MSQSSVSNSSSVASSAGTGYKIDISVIWLHKGDLGVNVKFFSNFLY